MFIGTKMPCIDVVRIPGLAWLAVNAATITATVVPSLLRRARAPAWRTAGR